MPGSTSQRPDADSVLTGREPVPLDGFVPVVSTVRQLANLHWLLVFFFLNSSEKGFAIQENV